MSEPLTNAGPEGDKNAVQAFLAVSEFRLGVYRHYKGGHYIAYSLSVKEDTLEPLVHYYSCKNKTRWTRTLQNFTSDVPENSTRPRRFAFLHSATWQQLAEAAGLDELVKGLQTLRDAHNFVQNIVR